MGFMGVTAFLSMWISNTATTAMMVPIAHAVLEQLHKTEKESRTAQQESLGKGDFNAAFELQETAPPPGSWLGYPAFLPHFRFSGWTQACWLLQKIPGHTLRNILGDIQRASEATK